MELTVLLVLCVCCFGGALGAEPSGQASGSQLQVNVCHLSGGRYRLLRIATSAWPGHARHTGDCCLKAAVCGARRCGTPQLPWKVDAKRRTCIPTCPASSTWDTATSSCLPSGPCASDPCAATEVLRANGTCFTDSGGSSGYSCGCVTGATWSNGECVDDDGCAAASGACAADQSGNFANGTCIDAPAPSTGFSCGCVTGATWSDSEEKCVDDDGCAATNPCEGVAGSNGTCLDEPAPKTGYTCACDAGRAWTGTACADDDGCAAAGGTCDANNANGTCIDAPAPSTGFSCGCITGATWSDMEGECVGEWPCGSCLLLVPLLSDYPRLTTCLG
ncbi:hypothetical protein COO60DRAFT_257015 [Scenedesmus sp. NREL 46B-D3]|nr:hypothetical protein COO60DRAFT_257015 [Scenedesmus sp. NREL 46B-D3]